MSSSVLLKTLFLLGCSALAFHRETQVLEMGREPRKEESSNCKAWKEKAPIWKILKKGNVTTYLECLHGYKPHITKAFFKNWFEERVNLHGVIVYLTKDFITEVTRLPKEGIKFSKETSISNAAFKKFPKTEAKEKNLEKNGDFYELNQIKVI